MKRSPWRFWAWPSELKQAGIVGINRRNGRFVLPLNPRAFYPRVDEKHITKAICHAAAFPVPETYALIESNGDVKRFLYLSGNRPEFVIKPAAGRGPGIVVVARHDGREFFTSSGQRDTLADLHYHVATVLSGLYSLQGQPDLAIVEQRIVCHEVFANVSEGGTPDIRVVLFRCVPVMAMVRLPTRASRGKANLHQGAAGAGVDLHAVTTFGGVLQDRAISVHPDTGHSIAGIQVPFWKDLLRAAMKLADGLEMGYIGVDFVVDANLGPVVLEANCAARLEHPSCQPPRFASTAGIRPAPPEEKSARRPARRGDCSAGGHVVRFHGCHTVSDLTGECSTAKNVLVRQMSYYPNLHAATLHGGSATEWRALAPCSTRICERQ